MVRKLSLAISLALGVASFDAVALGLGNIHTRSALNESFDADIELLAVKKGAIDSVKIELASQGTFERAGVERPFLLTKLKFTPERQPDGSAIIRVTSRDPIREPFLNFLIEVNWPEGRMIREYTVLLDPPASQMRMPGELQPGGIIGPVIGISEPIVTPMQGRRDEAGMGLGPAMAPPPGGYGPVRKKETLWSIAQRYQYPEAEMAQMVMAILRANPHAFIDGHVNNLRSGVTLAIPSLAEVRAQNAMQARNDYRNQLSSWRSAGPTASGEVARGEPKPTKPTPAAASGTRDAASGASGPDGELAIAASPSGGADSGESRGKIQRLEQELAVAQEAADSARRENDELRSRLDDLEAQIKDMQKLLALKDEQIAQVQEQMADSSGAAGGVTPLPVAAGSATSAAAEPATAPPEQPVTAPPEQPALAQQPEVKPEPESAAMPAAQPSEPEVAASTPAEQPQATEPTPEPVATPEPQVAQQPAVQPKPEPAQPTPEPVQPKPQPAPPPQEEDMISSVIGMVMDNIIYLAAGLGVLVLGGAGAWYIRRRKSDGDSTSDPESILMADASHGESEMATEDNPLSGLTTEETSFLDSLSSSGNFSEETELDDGDETSFLSDFVPSDIESLQEETGEVDPLAEADVYIAYGRFKQAEELVRQAMNKDPSKQEYRFKLFEVLHAAKDANGFSKLVAESAAMGLEKSDSAGWKRVMEMDRELSNGGGGLPQSEGAGDGLDDLDLGGLSETEDLASGGEEDDMDLDFSELGFDGDTEPAGNEGQPIASDDEDDFDGLDLTGLVGEDASKAAATPASAPAEDDDLDFDLDFSEETTIQSNSDADGHDDFALDLGDLGGSDEDISGIPDLGNQIGDLPGEADGLEITGMNKPEKNEDDLLDFSLNTGLDDEPSPAAAASASDVDPEEVATKLDLARAYVDMGDEDGARDILNEVVVEGTAEQKAEAQGLLSQLG